jgi:hypothetical protein
MGGPGSGGISKMTEARKKTILECLRVGSSRMTAAALAGIAESTLQENIRKGRTAPEGTAAAKFTADVEAAEAAPRHKALGIIMREMEGSPTLAWKFLERREPGFAPPVPNAAPAQPAGPVVIQLALATGSKDERPALKAVPEVIEGEYVEDSGAEATAES